MKTWLLMRYVAWAYQVGEDWIAWAEMTHETGAYETWPIDDRFMATITRMELWWLDKVAQPFALKYLVRDSQQLFNIVAVYGEYRDG